MGIQLEDGKGTGKRLEINAKNQAVTRAFTVSGENGASREGDAYFANTADTANTLTTATGNTYNMLFLQNDSSTSSMVIEKILTSADTAGGVVVWRKNMTVGSIGANNNHAPVNMNFSNNKVASVTCYSWDESGAAGVSGLTGGTVLKSFITNIGFTIHPIDAAVILGNGDNICVQYVNGTGGAVEFECGIRFYFDDTI